MSTYPSRVRSGGKIVKPRRTPFSRTPYDRPSLPPPPTNPNPTDAGNSSLNWLSTATRVIASGAGKLISSVFRPEPSSSSSTGSSSDDEVDNIDHLNDISSVGAERLGKDWWSSENKRVIEQLLVQETFSREESDRLIRIILSRVDTPAAEDSRSGNGIPHATDGNDAPMTDLYSTAVMEARKWLEDKKLGSGSKSELDCGTRKLDRVVSLHVNEGDVGSPVDVAKSFMQSRPPCASPISNPLEFKSLSPAPMQSFLEGSPYSVAGKSASSSKMKKDFITSGSWSITEEIRKVRAKATEDLLRTPSAKIDWSAVTSNSKEKPISAEMDMKDLGVKDKLVVSSLSALKSDDATINFATEADFGMPQDEARRDSLSSTPALLNSEQNQELSGTKSHGRNEDSGPNDRNGATFGGANELDGTLIPNGFPSEPRLETQLEQSEEENQIHFTCSNDEKVSANGHKEEGCELLSEASIEIPRINEIEDVTSVLESTTHHSRDDARLATVKDDTMAANIIPEKQRGKRPTGRYVRRGRGRGK